MENKTTVLYVDDEPINLMLFKAIFEVKFKVITAESGPDGLEELKANPGIAGVISDMRMPAMNGIEFINEAKKHFPDLFYFILTGYDISPEISGALNSGLIQKYFQKPFNNMEIENAILDSISN